MRAAYMTEVNAVQVTDAEEPKLNTFPRRHPEGRGVRHLRDRRTHVLQRRSEGAGPVGPGTSPSGTLVEVGPDADLPPDVEEGDRVSLGSILTCGECRWCTEGFQNLCEHHLLYGYDPFPGAYADYAAVPPIATKNLIPLPEHLPSDLATVADPFACALNGIEQLDIQLGDTVMILGTGPIGCWQAVMARDRGASRVWMTDVQRRPARHRHGCRREVHRRRVGRGRGQRGRGRARRAPTGSASNGCASLRRRSRRSRPRSRWPRSARGSCTSRGCRSTTRQSARHEPAPLQGARDPGRLRRVAPAVPDHDGLPRPPA